MGNLISRSRKKKNKSISRREPAKGSPTTIPSGNNKFQTNQGKKKVKKKDTWASKVKTDSKKPRLSTSSSTKFHTAPVKKGRAPMSPGVFGTSVHKV